MANLKYILMDKLTGAMTCVCVCVRACTIMKLVGFSTM